MTVTAASFIRDERFSVFSEMPGPKVTGAVAQAKRMWGEAECGDLWDDIVSYQTAQILATGYKGVPASKTRQLSETPYDAQLKQLLSLVRPGPVVACQ